MLFRPRLPPFCCVLFESRRPKVALNDALLAILMAEGRWSSKVPVRTIAVLKTDAFHECKWRIQYGRKMYT